MLWIIALILLGTMLYLSYCWYKDRARKHHVPPDIKIAPKDVVVQEIKKIENAKQPLSSAQLFALAETYHYGTYNPVNVAKAEQFYKASMAQSKNDPIHIGKCYLALGNIYKDGAMPEARKAIKHFLKAIEFGYEDGIVEIGKIYMHGLHPNYLPDKLMAGKIYNRVAHYPNISINLRFLCNENAAEISRLGYIDLDNIPEPGIEYFTLPYTILEDVENAVEKGYVIGLVPTKTEVVIFRKPHKPQPQNTLRELPRQREPLQENINILDLIPAQNIKSDSQNVHSSTVQNAVQKKLEHIESKGSISTSFDQNKKDFLEEVSTLNNISRDKVEKVMNSLKDSVHSRYNKTEMDIFNTVWSRINHPVNRARRSNMVEVLAENVASGIEHDIVVCSTGKIVRMVGALDGMDAEPLPDLKPEWAINEEISSTASKVRDDVLRNASSDERQAYEALTPTESQITISNKLTDEMKEALTSKCHEEYVKTGIMSKDALDFKLGQYLQGF